MRTHEKSSRSLKNHEKSSKINEKSWNHEKSSKNHEKSSIFIAKKHQILKISIYISAGWFLLIKNEQKVMKNHEFSFKKYDVSYPFP